MAAAWIEVAQRWEFPQGDAPRSYSVVSIEATAELNSAARSADESHAKAAATARRDGERPSGLTCSRLASATNSDPPSRSGPRPSHLPRWRRTRRAHPWAWQPGLKRLGRDFVLDCTNDRSEYGTARATGDNLRDNAANTQIARLSSGHNRRKQ